MRTHSLRLISVLAFGVMLFPPTLAAQQAPGRPTDAELKSTRSGGADWITYGGALNNQRYSTLDQVNTSNVSQLRGAWLTRLGSGRGGKYRFEADPVVIDGVMYIPTGNDDIFALDAKTGRKMWEYFSDIPQTNDLICCGWNNRGVAVGGGKVFSGQLDGTLVALDQQTGRIAWKVQLEDYTMGYSITGATRYLDGLVFTGMSGAENGVRGRVHALDANTGAEVWKFYTVPAPGEVGGDTWPSPNDPDPVRRDAYLHGGATVWQGVAIDPDLGMMYFSTGNAGPDYDGAVRPGDNLFAASMVAIDYRTGQYRWHFQEVKHDVWDYDAPSPVVLFDQVYNGVPRQGVYQAGKTGWLYFLDRTNGQPLIGIEDRPVAQEPRNATAATQPFPLGDAFVRQCGEPVEGYPMAGCIFDPFWDIPVIMQPFAGGGSNWNPTSYSQQTGYVYVMGNERNFGYARRPEVYTPGRRYTGGANVTPLGSPIGSTFTAIDSRTNRIVWQKRAAGESNYGAMSTAGGLVFTGQVDGNMTALDAATGAELWRFQLGWGVSAPPMTYMVDGVQYVTIAAGGNRGGLTTLDGDAVWTFSLNGTIDEIAAPPPIQTKVELTGQVVQIGGPIARPQDIGGERVFEGTIDTADYVFIPQRVGVVAGTTLVWRNTGAVIHTATDNRQTWDTGDIPAGEARSITFDAPGTYTYTCSPHPWMFGQVIVT